MNDFKAFVGELPDNDDFFTNTWFAKLKADDERKWKKAIKQFYIKVNKRYKLK